MTESVDYGDQGDDYPAEPVRGPITLGRERRILAALRAAGPLTEAELCEFINLKPRKLGKPLVNLAISGKVACTPRTTLGGLSVRTWHLTPWVFANDSQTGPR